MVSWGGEIEARGLPWGTGAQILVCVPPAVDDRLPFGKLWLASPGESWLGLLEITRLGDMGAKVPA